MHAPDINSFDFKLEDDFGVLILFYGYGPVMIRDVASIDESGIIRRAPLELGDYCSQWLTLNEMRRVREVEPTT